MQTKTVERAIKRSLIYSFAVTQPFTLHQTFATALQDASIFEHTELEYGSHGELVRHVQLKLKKLGHYEDAVDGVYGLFTEQAVRSFQSSEAITISGIINKETYETLVNTEKQIAFDNIASEFQAIYYGERSERVKLVQEVLYFYGYYHGNIDGIYGPLTEEAMNDVYDAGILTNLKEENLDMLEVDEQGETDTLMDTNSTTAVSEGNINKDHVSVIPLDVAPVSSNIIADAKTLIGTPYVWGGSTPSGFDCSGFIQYVYNQQQITIPRTVNDIWNFATPISSPSIGDLVFFETYQPGPSHIGIYLGGGNFIHAGTSTGVTISNMQDNNYWKSKYIGAKRIK